MCTENRDKLRIVINYDPPGLQIFTVAEKIRGHTCDNIPNRRQFLRDKPDTVIICVTRIKTNQPFFISRSNPFLSMKSDKIMRRRRVAEMYLNHCPIHTIAEELGVTRQTVSKDLSYLMAVWEKDANEQIAKRRTREITELERMERSACIEYEKSHTPKWMDVRLKIKMLRMKYMGLALPQSLDISGTVNSIQKIDLSGLTYDELNRIEAIISGSSQIRTADADRDRETPALEDKSD